MRSLASCPRRWFTFTYCCRRVSLLLTVHTVLFSSSEQFLRRVQREVGALLPCVIIGCCSNVLNVSSIQRWLGSLPQDYPAIDRVKRHPPQIQQFGEVKGINAEAEGA